MTAPLIQAEQLTKAYRNPGFWGRSRAVAAVSKVNFTVGMGETVGLIGESGSGKSTTGELVAGLLRPDAGRILYQGKDIAGMRKAEWLAFRREVQIIWQNPRDSLDPALTAGQSIAEPLKLHKLCRTDSELRQEIARLLDAVGLPGECAERKPSELSGGQCQRVTIARALALKPKLIICDEILSALDVSVQAQVLILLNKIQKEFGVSYLFISHDLSPVRLLTDRVLVMLEGRIVDEGPTLKVLAESRVPYTRQLVAAVPGQPEQFGRRFFAHQKG